MARFSWITRDLTDGAVITTNSQATGAPVTNLLEDQPSEQWVSNGIVTGITIDVDFGAVVAFDWVSLMYHNGTSAGTVALSSADAQGALGSAFSSERPALVVVF